MLETLLSFITSFLSKGGYPTLFILTTLDSTVLPVPNEAIMPFTGALIAEGRFTFLPVIIISSIGAVLGASTSYFLGKKGALPFVKKFGKYLKINEQDIQKTHLFFEKHGEKTILISRFIPIVRQFISIPAGAAKMNFLKFCIYTAIGSFFWNSLILFLGYMAGINLETIKTYLSVIEKIVLIAIFISALWFISKKIKKTNS